MPDNTPRLALPYPVGDDDVDVPRDIEALAQALDPIVVETPVDTAEIADDAVTLAKLAQAVRNLLVPTGAISAFAGASAPSGWLLCDGQAVTTANPSLRTLLVGAGSPFGTTGGDPRVPDLRGRVPVGRDAAQNEFNVLGETGGAKFHTLTVAELPSHSHLLTRRVASTSTTWTSSSVSLGTDSNFPRATSAGAIFDLSDTQPAGSGAAHANLQPYAVINWIVKAG